MIREHPFSSEEGVAQAIANAGASCVLGLSACAELIAAALLIESDVSSIRLAELVQRLRLKNAVVERQFSDSQVTVDQALSFCSARLKLFVVENQTLRTIDEIGVGYLGGRGIVKYATLLSQEDAAEQALPRLFARIAWQHEHAEARTSFARQLACTDRLDTLHLIASWLWEHVRSGADDLPQTLFRSAWQLSCEILNHAKQNRADHRCLVESVLHRFGFKHGDEFVCLIKGPPDAVELLDPDIARRWAAELSAKAESNDAQVQTLGWLGLSNHSRLSSQRRSELYSKITSDDRTQSLAINILKNQSSIPEDNSVLQLLGGLNQPWPKSKPYLEIALARVNQAEFQATLLELASVFDPHDINRPFHVIEILRAAELTPASLQTIFDKLLNGPAHFKEMATTILLSQPKLPDELLDLCEKRVGLFASMRPSSRHFAHLLFRFRPAFSTFPLGQTHKASYNPDPIAKYGFSDVQWQFEDMTKLAGLLTQQDSFTEMVNAHVAARLLRHLRMRPTEVLLELLQDGRNEVRELAAIALSDAIAYDDSARYRATSVASQLVKRILSCAGSKTVFFDLPDKLQDTLSSVLLPEWHHTAESRILPVEDMDEVIKMLPRDMLALDIRLLPAVTDRTDEMPTDEPQLKKMTTRADRDLLLSSPTALKFLSDLLETLVAHLDPNRDQILDDLGFAMLLKGISEKLPHDDPAPAVAFYAYLAWCHNHQKYRPRYSEVAPTIDEDDFALLPKSLSKHLQAPKKEETFSRYINRFLASACAEPLQGVREFLRQRVLQERS